MVVAGVAVVASARARGGAHRGRARWWRGVKWGSLTGVTIATYTLWDAHAMTGLALPPLPYFALGTFWQAALMVPGLRGRRAELTLVVRLHWRESLCVAVLSPLAYVLVLQALTTTSVAVVAPARESSVVVGSLLAWRLFHEPAPLRKFAGATIVLAGIVLIAA